MVVDLRRAVDVLMARKEVDSKRIGYVGHSLGATCSVASPTAFRPATPVSATQTLKSHFW